MDCVYYKYLSENTLPIFQVKLSPFDCSLHSQSYSACMPMHYNQCVEIIINLWLDYLTSSDKSDNLILINTMVIQWHMSLFNWYSCWTSLSLCKVLVSWREPSFSIPPNGVTYSAMSLKVVKEVSEKTRNDLTFFGTSAYVLNAENFLWKSSYELDCLCHFQHLHVLHIQQH